MRASASRSRVLNALHSQIERVIAGKRDQIKTEGLQRVERLGRREKSPALMNGLAFFGDGGFQVGENHVALEQALNRRHGLGRGLARVRAKHGLPRQRDRDRGRLLLRGSIRREQDCR